MRLISGIVNIVALALGLGLTVSAARGQVSPSESVPRRTSVSDAAGAQLSLSAGMFLPPEGGRLGLALAGDARYGVTIGRATVAPGVRLAGFLRPEMSAVAPLAMIKVSTRSERPVGTVEPYLLGGVGFGHASEHSHEGVAYQAGAGLSIWIGTRMSVGGELTYLAITGCDFRALFFGPSLTASL